MRKDIEYAEGKYIIGHWVKWKCPEDPRRRFVKAMLVSAKPKYAEVVPVNHKQPMRAEWSDLTYDTGGNALSPTPTERSGHEQGD